MKDRRPAATGDETNCQHLGDLAGLAVPEQTSRPAMGQWAAIEARLEGSRRGPSRRHRWPVFAVCAVLVLGTVGWLVARRPLGYRLDGCDGCRLAVDGEFESLANGGGTIAFEDGSRVAFEKDARFRLAMLPFRRGAEINLDEGETEVAVVHRAKAHWAVLAGPFRVDVTGTRFGVRWSRDRGQFRLTMKEGDVRVGGGPIPPDTHLHGGQTMNADLVGGTFEIANERALPRAEEATPTQAAPAVPDKADSATHHQGIRFPAPPLPRRRVYPHARVEPRLASTHSPAEQEAATETVPPPAPLEARSVTPPAPQAPERLTAPARTEIPAKPAPIVERKPTSLRVVIGESGQLANGLTGSAWIASGNGTSFSSPKSWEGRTHLVPEGGLLCTSGTLAGVSCVNEGLPQMTCNWSNNWGVAIGWHARADQKAWGDQAAHGIAVEFRGRSASYRLNVHLKGDPAERIYCIENYKSGQVVRPSMFKSACWSDSGETLDSFSRVDTFNLQHSSGMSYVAFRYCVSAITLVP